MERKTIGVAALMAAVVAGLGVGGYYSVNQSAQTGMHHDCLVIISKDNQVRLNVVNCAQAPIGPPETIKVVPIR
jgi:hypothetical protein